MRLSRKLIYLITAAIILTTGSISTAINRKNITNSIDTAIVNTAANKPMVAIDNIDKAKADVVLPKVTTTKEVEKQTTSTTPAQTTKVTVKSATVVAKPAPAVKSTAVITKASAPAVKSTAVITKTSAPKPSISKPPVVSTKLSPPPASKPAELKTTVVTPSSKPIEVAPEVKPAPITNPVSRKLVLGYGTYYYAGDSSSYNSLTKYGSNISELATHTYSIKSDGSLIIPGGLFPETQVAYANSKGIKTLAAIRNEEGDKFSGPLASNILNTAEIKEKLINQIYNTVKAKNFKGVNIDFEMLNSKDRNAYTAFIKEVSEKLHKDGYLVTIAVPAKTFDSAKAYWTYAYDYKSLGAYADQVVLMTYDEHWQSGTPGPVASISWVQQVANYAASVIPRSKLILGLGTYGYDWMLSGGYAKSYSIQGAYSTAAKYGAEIQWDDTSKVPYFMYTDSTGAQRIVYFEDSTSISYKLNIVNTLNLGGVAVWRLGLEDANYWTTIRDKIK